MKLIRCEKEKTFQNEKLADAQREEKGWGAVGGEWGQVIFAVIYVCREVVVGKS